MTEILTTILKQILLCLALLALLPVFIVCWIVLRFGDERK
jgi:hypothetical protein